MVIDKEAYTLRIAQSTPAQLVVITFELTTEFIKDAIENNDNPEMFRSGLDRAKNGVMQLVYGLDFSADRMAQDFYDIYQYVFKLLVRADVTCKAAPAKEALDLLTQLLKGWREAVKHESVKPDAEAPQVYAGLTYKRGGLAEYIVEDERKNFKA